MREHNYTQDDKPCSQTTIGIVFSGIGISIFGRMGLLDVGEGEPLVELRTVVVVRRRGVDRRITGP